MAVQRLANGWFPRWIFAVLLLGCSSVPDGRMQPTLEQQSPGEPRSPGEQQPPGMGVLAGRVTTESVPPAGGPGGVRPPGPFPGGVSTPVAVARVGITPVGSSHTWWVVTGVEGDFAIRLLAGTYRVTMDVRPGQGVAKNLPATVTVTAGQETRLEIHLDSGIR